jgi:circadian clock protein KaiC
MNLESISALTSMRKSPTGILGFDEITGGGLPRGRTTLIAGGPGCGKTVFGLQFLVNGANDFGEAGIFVAFEEGTERLIANAESFGWRLRQLRKNKVLFVDAQLKLDAVQSGDFDLCGMLAGLQLQAKQIKAKRIVFDALDMVLALLPDHAARRREAYRLHHWLMERDLTCVLPSRPGPANRHTTRRSHTDSCSSWWTAP